MNDPESSAGISWSTILVSRASEMMFGTCLSISEFVEAHSPTRSIHITGTKNMATIQGVYLALFGRPADPAGLAYFNGVSSNGTNLSAIGDLSGTAEYTARFSGLDNSQIVNSIFVSLFGRDADAAGLNFFVGELAAGRQNINTIAINILDGARNDDLTVVQNKLVASNLFTSHLDLTAEQQAYVGDFAASAGRDLLDGITKDASSIPDAAVVDQQILFLFRDGNAPAPAHDVDVVGMGHHDGSFI